MREHLTEEHKRKISEAHRGMKLSPETRAKISKAMTGLKRSDETKRKISAAGGGREVPADVRVRISAGVKSYREGQRFKRAERRRQLRLFGIFYAALTIAIVIMALIIRYVI